MPRNQHGARCSRQNRHGAARTRALAQKPGTDHDFLGKFGADLCGPDHLAKKPFPQTTVFSAKQARTCADPSIQTRNPPRTTVFSAKQARTEHGVLGKTGTEKHFLTSLFQSSIQAKSNENCMGSDKNLVRNWKQWKNLELDHWEALWTLAFRPETHRGPRFSRQNKRGPCSGLLGITKVTIGTYRTWSSKPSIPCRSRAPSLAVVWGEGGVRIKECKHCVRQTR